MSERYCYELWQSALGELQTLLNENAGSSQDKDRLAKAYLRYLQVLKQLDEVHTYIRQPQHREAVVTALLYCAALLTEAWSALVAANNGIDVIDFGSYLLELQLTPDDLEVPIPAVLKPSERPGQAKVHAALAAVPEKPCIAAPTQYSTKTSPSTPAYSKIASTAVPLDASVEKNMSPDEAAIKIQSAWRGWRDRCSAANRRDQELEYLGMVKHDITENTGSVDLEEGAVARRQRRHHEYDQARLEIEELLQVQETPLMVLEERNQVNSWLEAKIKNERERWPEVPLDGELGGIAQDSILNSENTKIQPTKQKSGVSVKDKAASSAPGKARKVGAGSRGSSASASEAPKSLATLTFASQLEGLIKTWKVDVEKALVTDQVQHDTWEIGKEATTTVADEPLPALEGLPVPRRGSSIDAIDLKLLANSTRPRLKEKVRLTVREQARQAAAAANAARPAPPATIKQKQSTTGLKPTSKVSVPSSKTSATIIKGSSKPGTGSKEPKEPKREPLPPLRDLEEILNDLVEHQIAVKCPETNFSNFLGTCSLLHGSSSNATGDTQPPTPVKKAKSGGKAANMAAKTSQPLVLYPELSFAQVRQMLTVKCALPLTIQGFTSDQKIKTLMASNSSTCCCPVTALIYGPSGSGKTMLVHAIAHESKASLFDLSPKTLSGKYPGQLNIDVAVQSVFAAAKAAAPAIIYIDNVEQLFIRDEKRVALLAEETGGEPVSRIRRQFLVEIAALQPQDGVLVLCTSKEPHACVSADEATFVSFFQFLVHIPLPDDRCRREILQNLATELNCVQIWTSQQLTLATQLTQGYTTGAVKSILMQSLELYRASTESNEDILDCFIKAVASRVKPDSAEVQTVAEWTARAHTMLGKTTSVGALPSK